MAISRTHGSRLAAFSTACGSCGVLLLIWHSCHVRLLIHAYVLQTSHPAATRCRARPIVAARSHDVVIITCVCTMVLALRLATICSGELHGLINNVGINIRKPTLQYTAADVQTLLSVNLASAFHLSQLCYPQLQAADNASVLFMSSVAGGPLAMKSGCVYAMTKGAAALDTVFPAHFAIHMLQALA